MDFLSSIPFLATAIAIVISWALFAILCSLAQEAAAQVIADRGRFMRTYLLKQLQDLPNGVNWAALLYLHGSIDMMSRADNKPTSYISPDLFAKTLIEVVGNSHLVQMQLTSLAERAERSGFCRDSLAGLCSQFVARRLPKWTFVGIPSQARLTICSVELPLTRPLPGPI